MDTQQIAEVIRQCESPGMTFNVVGSDEGFYMQVSFHAPEEEQSWTGVRPSTIQKGRKWLLSTHMTRNEIVQTCFLAVLTAVEHEVRENFRYRERKIFNPHFSPDVLWEVARKTSLDLRAEPTVK